MQVQVENQVRSFPGKQVKCKCIKHQRIIEYNMSISHLPRSLKIMVLYKNCECCVITISSREFCDFDCLLGCEFQLVDFDLYFISHLSIRTRYPSWAFIGAMTP